MSTIGYNQNGEIVISWDRKFFVYKKDSDYAKFNRPKPDSPWDKE